MTDAVTDIVTDAELVFRFRRGDEAAFSLMYRRHAAGLQAFVIRQVRDRAAAEDLVQEVFVLASQRIDQLADPERLRPWLYAIAARQAMSFLRRRRFEASVDDHTAQLADAAAGPEDAVTAGERLDVLLAAAAGLAAEDRRVVRLFLSGFDGAALARACDTGPEQARLRLHRAKKRLALSLGALLVARHGRRACPQLDALLVAWDGELSPLLRKRIVRHVEDCADCERLRLRLVRPEALIGVLVLCGLPAAWRAGVVDELRTVSATRPADGANGDGADRTGGGGGGTGDGGGGGGGTGRGVRMRGSGPGRTVAAAGSAVAVLAVLGIWAAHEVGRPADGAVGVAGPPVTATGPGVAEPARTAPSPATARPASTPSGAPAVGGTTRRPAPGGLPVGPSPTTAPPRSTPPAAPTARLDGRWVSYPYALLIRPDGTNAMTAVWPDGMPLFRNITARGRSTYTAERLTGPGGSWEPATIELGPRGEYFIETTGVTGTHRWTRAPS